MAICESATRFDNDSYYQTTVNEETEEASIIGEMNGEPVEFTLGGGGGSSDFSTAQVTLVNGGSVTLPVTQEANPSRETPAYLMVVGQSLKAGTYSVPLYKGGLMVDLPSGTTVSGNIQPIGMGYFITGDCTITIS